MTPPQEALASPVSDRSDDRPNTKAPGGLICPASDIFDADARATEINAACSAARGAKDVRAAAVAILQDALKAGRAAIAQAFEADPKNAWPTVRAYSYLTDCIVKAVLDVAMTHLHPAPAPTNGERIAVLAVGGYGRAEMAPYSDVDLLFLTPYKITPWAESVIETMLYIFRCRSQKM